MPGQTTIDIQAALVRLRAGDSQAIDALIGRAYLRMHRLARRQLRGFERVRRFQDADDVVQDACVRLLRRLESKPPTDPAEFFAWAAREIRCQLLDLVRSHYGPLGAGRRETNVTANTPEPAHSESDRMAWWAEFHNQAEKLPTSERCAFELRWYHGMTWSEAASVLNISEATVKRYWQSARERLHAVLGPDLPGV
jgi:RNA polymerase sigma-70 factor (ECF subfamily)